MFHLDAGTRIAATLSEAAVHPMKTLFLTTLVALMSSSVFAQTTPAEASLATTTGQQLTAGINSYTYREPGDHSISIHSPMKLGGGYTLTRSLSRRTHWFIQANGQGAFGATTYTGWCSPFLIAPNSASPNGYELDLGDPSPCTDSGNPDWYVEAHGLAGKDLIGRRWAVSPYSGVGVRHLSNSIAGIPGYRTDNYLYVPIGVTARTRVSDHVLSFTVEFDQLLHGWQTTRDSDLGSGTLPATPTAPSFSIDGFTDVSFTQSGGRALRASAQLPLTKRVSVMPYFVHWTVNASSVNAETVAFTVNNITAHEQFGAYEPFNVTNEFGVRLGFHF